MTAGSGLVVLATMHTTLDRAQTALDDAQAKLGEALDANPSGTLRALLAQTQATLVAAQVSLAPLLREELATAERDAADLSLPGRRVHRHNRSRWPPPLRLTFNCIFSPGATRQEKGQAPCTA